MFWNKTTVEASPQFEVCSQCKHLIKAGSGQKVLVSSIGISWGYHNEYSEIFCDLHKRPYDRIEQYSPGTKRYYKKIEPWQEVTEEGKPIKK